MKPTPVYTLSHDTLATAEITLQLAIRSAWRHYVWLTGEDRVLQRKYLRDRINALRQIRGYREAKIRLSVRRKILRSIPKRLRRHARAALAIAHARRPSHRPRLAT